MVLDFIITVDKQLYLLILNNDLSVQFCHWKDLLALNITLVPQCIEILVKAITEQHAAK